MNITDSLLLYRNSMNPADLGCPQNTDIEKLNVISIEILSWLKLEHKRSLWEAQGRPARHRPLDLNMEYSWCQLLASLLMEENVFSKVLRISNCKLSFKPELEDKYIQEEERKAYERYNPMPIK